MSVLIGKGKFVFCFLALFLVTSFSSFADGNLTVPSENLISDEWILEDTVIVESVAPVTPSSSNGFKAIILGLIGNYDPVVVEYRYQNTSTGTYSYLRQIEHDYPWIASACIFALLLFLAWLFLRCIFSAVMR